MISNIIMKHIIMTHLAGLLLILVTQLSYGQAPESAATDSTATSVRVFEDPRFTLIVNQPVQTRPAHGKAKGYRVQIYSGNDRNRANDIKMEFLRHYPEYRAYLVYHRPQFRVRVGDFANRKDASVFVQMLAGRYMAMIVPDVINIATINRP